MYVILSSLSTTFTFSPELDDTVLFNIDGIPYCPPRTPRDREFLVEMRQLCHEKLKEAADTGYSVILINNTPLTLEVLKEIQDVSAFPYASGWLILSFFHNDKALIKNKVKVTDTEYLNPQIIIDVKSQDCERLADYPFIKKINIPHGFKITMKYLNKLLDDKKV
jgi:hypothetical protein